MTAGKVKVGGDFTAVRNGLHSDGATRPRLRARVRHTAVELTDAGKSGLGFLDADEDRSSVTLNSVEAVTVAALLLGDGWRPISP